MWILVDSHSDVPASVQTLVGKAQKQIGPQKSVELETFAMTVFDHPEQDRAQNHVRLPLWRVETHSFARSEEVHVGILARLFDSSASRMACGLVYEAKRFTVLKDGPTAIEVGVAVRLAVISSMLTAEMNLTLPNIAANAQINDAEAHAVLSVSGFDGPLGDLLPPPEPLDVDSYALFLDAFRKLQAHVFGNESVSFFSPVLLSYNEKRAD